MSHPRARTGHVPLRPAGRRRSVPSVNPAADARPRRSRLHERDLVPLDGPHDPRLARARWLLVGLFALNGLMFSGWLARIPTVRDALGMSSSELGGILVAGSIGSLATVSLAGVLVERFGGRFVLWLSTGAFASGYVLIGLGPTIGSVPVLTAGIFLSGVSFALGNVPLNVETAAVERRMGRTVLPQFHAAFSVGAVLGSGIGALAAHGTVPILLQLTATAVVGLVWRALSIPHVVVDSLPPTRSRSTAVQDAQSPVRRSPAARLRAARLGRRTRPGAALSAWREPRTVLIGVVIMSAALSEGSANDWLALAVVDGFSQPEAVGAAMFGVFVGAMTAVRLLGTRLIDRFGRVAVLRASGLVSLGGLVLFGFAPSLPLAAVGIVAWGFGAALSVPIGIAAASDDPLRAASRVAVISAFSSTASLAAPPLLGIAAQHLGARHALVLITAAMLASIALSRRVARPVPASAEASGSVAPAPLPAEPWAEGVPGPDGTVVPSGVRAPESVVDLPDGRCVAGATVGHRRDSEARPAAREHT